MLYALNCDGTRSKAAPNTRAACPSCHQDLISKCGLINIWHWSHKADECDPWYEPESNWHLSWKSLVPQENSEVIIGSHRADILIPDKTVVELQSSSIDPREINEREAFYKNIVWLVPAEPFKKNLSFYNKGTHYSFRWKHMRKSQAYMHRLIWDLGDGLFSVKGLHPPKGEELVINSAGEPIGISSRQSGAGWGKFIDREKFVRWLGGRP